MVLMHSAARRFLALAILIMAGCGRQSHAVVELATARGLNDAESVESGLVSFVDRARELGVDFTYSDGSSANLSTMLESLGGGLGWVDFDRDGWLDLVAAGGGSFPSEKSMAGCNGAMFRNQDGKRFVLVSGRASFGNSDLFSNGVAIGDCDNDGFQDVLITGFGQPQLWRNMGDGTFREDSAVAGILNDRWGSSAGWADFNGDGNLDLYLEHYVNWSLENHPYCGDRHAGKRDNCPPREFQPLPDSVFYGQGDGTWIDATATAQLRSDGKGLGVLLFDAEPDGDVDVYVANDTTDNFLYVNDGRGVFEEIGIAAGVARDDHGVPDGSMGVDICDFNADGRPDIWVANYEREMFAMYRNQGYDRFLHVSQRLGITDLGGVFVGFGTACSDFDSDGDEDIIVANGHVIKYSPNSPRKQLPLFLQYDGSRFLRVHSEPGTYFGDPHEGRGLAVADFDRDGDLDIAVLDLKDPLALLENQFHEQNRCLALTLVGVGSNRDAIGARVAFETSNGTRYRQVTGGGSYLSHSSRCLHFPLPADVGPRLLVVDWPSGLSQEIDASSLAGEVTLIEPHAEGEASPRFFIQQEFE